MATGHLTRDDWGKFLLRVTIGGLLLFHGIHKLQGGVDAIEGMLAAKGFPSVMVYGVYVGEVIAPLLMLAGVLVRLAGFFLALNMVVAIALAHSEHLFAIDAHGGWAIELQVLYLLGGIVLMLLGGGRIGFSRKS
jgi:putative oxidoreductase